MHSFKSVSVDLWWHKRYFKYLAQNWTSNNEHDIYLFWTTEHLGWVLKFWLRYIHPANKLCPFETSTLYSPSCFPHTFGIWLSTWIYWLSKVTLNTYYMPETTQDASRKVNLPNGSMVQFLFFFPQLQMSKLTLQSVRVFFKFVWWQSRWSSHPIIEQSIYQGA